MSHLRSEYQITIHLHSEDAYKKLTHPEAVREIVATALDGGGRLQEEVDFTLTVNRVYEYDKGFTG